MMTYHLLIPRQQLRHLHQYVERNAPYFIAALLISFSLLFYFVYYQNGLGLAYNDARSHLDIGRRVVEGLKPGLAQLGSVWLPLPHILMIPTIWQDFLWHSGLSGALQSMLAFVITAMCIYSYLRMLHVGILGRIVGVFIFVVNLNVLYLQSTAMTELLLLATVTLAVYELTRWSVSTKALDLMKASFWVMLTTLVRYDGWFLFLYAIGVVAIICWRRGGFKLAEGTLVLFCTLGGLGIVGWLVWNQLIFGDALYFAFGPFSAHAQQQQLSQAGVLITKGNLLFSLKVYLYALMYNSGSFTALLGLLGGITLLTDRRLSFALRLAASALLAPLWFNILALYLGHSVLFIQGLSGDTWFNARYGIMMLPSIAIFVGYLFHRIGKLQGVLVGLLVFVTFFALSSGDAVTIDDARVGSSQKNVSEVSSWLHDHTARQKGFILISAASHDAIIFSSGLPMKRFIHEGTGEYWLNATHNPDQWARWIVMRTNDLNDLTFKAVNKSGQLSHYSRVASYPFADVYELKPEFLATLKTDPILSGQK